MNAPALKIDRIHPVACRCKDVRETENLNVVLAVAEDDVPSIHDPSMRLFPDAGNGNVLAFFELATKPRTGRDPNTRKRIPHIALTVRDHETLPGFKDQIKANGAKVRGVTDHAICFFDPNGHCVEPACPDPEEEEAMLTRLDAVKGDMLEKSPKDQARAQTRCQKARQGRHAHRSPCLSRS